MSVNNIVVTGNISASELQKILSEHFKGEKSVIVSEGKGEEGAAEQRSRGNSKEDDETSLLNSILVSSTAYPELKANFAAKVKEVNKIEKSNKQALSSVQIFQQQQKQLFDEFVLLRQRYDEQRTSLLDTLWDKCAPFHAELSEIPIQEDEQFLEDMDHIGIYNLGNNLGEGQFATVRGCTVSHTRGNPKIHDFNTEYAIKTLNKDKLLSFHSLKRVSNEVKILKMLSNEYIVRIVDVIQTKMKLYIVTEKGGPDLFEFFEEHGVDGIPEPWAREIMKCIVMGVAYCHNLKVCHRDLKPENILLTFDAENSRCISLKLCDFGLASEYKDNTPFTDFCGSPGFFAPEMITRGSYFGNKVDKWSCGCILLELVLGHERFCELWMGSYDYEVMQEKATFSSEIKASLERLKSELDFSDELNNFIMQFLQLKPQNRPSMKQILGHEWLALSDREKIQAGIMLSDGTASPEAVDSRMRVDVGGADDRSQSPIPGAPIGTPDRPSELHRASSGGHLGGDDSVDPELVKKIYNNQSQKERKVFEDFNQDKTDRDQVHLPPIEPPTPNVGQARKILLRGADLANKIAHSNSSSAMNTPVSSPGGGSVDWRGEMGTPTHKMSGSAVGASLSPAGTSNGPNMHGPGLHRAGSGNVEDLSMSPSHTPIGKGSHVPAVNSPLLQHSQSAQILSLHRVESMLNTIGEDEKDGGGNTARGMPSSRRGSLKPPPKDLSATADEEKALSRGSSFGPQGVGEGEGKDGGAILINSPTNAAAAAAAAAGGSHRPASVTRRGSFKGLLPKELGPVVLAVPADAPPPYSE